MRSVPLSQVDQRPPLSDAPSSAEQAQAAQEALASNGPVGIAVQTLKAQLLPEVADRVATQGFRPYVDPLNRAAGGVLVHAYAFRGCDLRIVVNPEIWSAMSAADQQAWERRLAGPQQALSPQCTRTDAVWTTEIVDLKGDKLAAF